MQTELAKIVLWGNNGQTTLTEFESFEYDQCFLVPTDGFHFEIGDPARIQEVLSQVSPGSKVEFYLGDDELQMVGYVDIIRMNQTRGGSTLSVIGRDSMSRVCDGTMKATDCWTDKDSFAKILEDVLTPYFKTIVLQSDQYDVKGNIITGSNRFNKEAKGIRKATKKGRATKSWNRIRDKQLKPGPEMHKYQFIEQTARRLGLFVWSEIQEGREVAIVGEPDFDQEPLYSIHNVKGNSEFNNILGVSSQFNYTYQVPVVIAQAVGNGGSWRSSSLKVLMINEVVGKTQSGITKPEVRAMIEDYQKRNQNVSIIDRFAFTIPNNLIQTSQVIPRYVELQDHESDNLLELQNFVYRKMAEMQSTFMNLSYTVDGFRDPMNGNIYRMNTMINVRDEFSGIDQPMWIKARTFSQDRSGGTTTKLELILPYTLEI